MKYIPSAITTAVFTWPALLLGYVFEAAWTGFEAGRIIYNRQAEAGLKHFGKDGQ